MENKEIYTPMEKILVEGATRLSHNEKLMALLEFELEQHMKRLEEQVELQGEVEL